MPGRALDLRSLKAGCARKLQSGMVGKNRERNAAKSLTAERRLLLRWRCPFI
jgi:hypothetical protein